MSVEGIRAVRPSSRPRAALRVVGGLAGLGFMAVAFVRGLEEGRGLPLPAPGALAAALIVVVIGLCASLCAWTVLLPGPGAAPTARRLAAGFFAAQLGKYVPGAVWQAVGQVDAARGAGVPAPRAAAAFGVSALTQAAAGGTVGALVVLADVGWALRLGALAAAGLLVVLDRRWMARVLGWLRPGLGTVLPAADAIRRSWLLGLVPQLGHGAAFALLLGSTGSSVPLMAVPAACLAWTVGFLALPFPSGLGVREAVLLAALGGAGAVAAPTAAGVVAASVALRLVTIVAELLLLALTARGLRRGR